jgi:hypothetical protein
MWYVVLTFKDDIFRLDFMRSFMQFQHHNLTLIVENFGINLKEVIDRFIWTIELCHI